MGNSVSGYSASEQTDPNDQSDLEMEKMEKDFGGDKKEDKEEGSVEEPEAEEAMDLEETKDGDGEKSEAGMAKDGEGRKKEGDEEKPEAEEAMTEEERKKEGDDPELKEQKNDGDGAVRERAGVAKEEKEKPKEQKSKAVAEPETKKTKSKEKGKKSEEKDKVSLESGRSLVTAERKRKAMTDVETASPKKARTEEKKKPSALKRFIGLISCTREKKEERKRPGSPLEDEEPQPPAKIGVMEMVPEEKEKGGGIGNYLKEKLSAAKKAIQTAWRKKNPLPNTPNTPSAVSSNDTRTAVMATPLPTKARPSTKTKKSIPALPRSTEKAGKIKKAASKNKDTLGKISDSEDPPKSQRSKKATVKVLPDEESDDSDEETVPKPKKKKKKKMKTFYICPTDETDSDQDNFDGLGVGNWYSPSLENLMDPTQRSVGMQHTQASSRRIEQSGPATTQLSATTPSMNSRRGAAGHVYYDSDFDIPDIFGNVAYRNGRGSVPVNSVADQAPSASPVTAVPVSSTPGSHGPMQRPLSFGSPLRTPASTPPLFTPAASPVTPLKTAIAPPQALPPSPVRDVTPPPVIPAAAVPAVPIVAMAPVAPQPLVVPPVAVPVVVQPVVLPAALVAPPYNAIQRLNDAEATVESCYAHILGKAQYSLPSSVLDFIATLRRNATSQRTLRRAHLAGEDVRTRLDRVIARIGRADTSIRNI